ncbi:Nitrogenase molybdenum-iron protein beta chain [Syntrophomonas zehnderi OL-4]|uniref:Nitrogenase molybdenum-iron protein beta chain n=1 Tax=Syntrophomonas zehnderi OL-4 TaxID=690567 RepID=A0A0E3W3B7_9FIRM|nr:nitrogenase molybdenum-iron protein subunit beta [Syntrophomonas zehnderi]CFX70096.1 Nitrogenase molybdenum-iron protein beta chain [Syntrophomonas zehnderi OL-4]
MWDYTPPEIIPRNGIVINPAKTCQPIGAMYAALGVHRCLPHSHGSQGCCSYHRMHLSRHFRDPIAASTSSFTEGAAVFGGGANLKTALKNVFAIYNPDIIAVHTTCLSETIGDDIQVYINQAQVPPGKAVIYANTPSYVGSHVTGFSNMVKGMVKGLSVNNNHPNGKVNIIPGFVNPGDMREIKRMLKAMEVRFIMFPDTSGVLDAPLTGKYEMYPAGGTKIEELIDAGNSTVTLALGSFASEDAAQELRKKAKVRPLILRNPIGIRATDNFLMAVSRATGQEISAELEEERGQVIDVMVDLHDQYQDKKVAVFGDPDIVIALTSFLLELGMVPNYVLTGTPSEAFAKEVEQMLDEAGIKGRVKAGGDLFTLHQWIKEAPVDLLMGTSYGKYIAKAENIPLVRVGFPILDRGVHSYLPIVGYKGALRLIEMISNALLDKQDREAADEDFELIL